MKLKGVPEYQVPPTKIIQDDNDELPAELELAPVLEPDIPDESIDPESEPDDDVEEENEISDTEEADLVFPQL